MSAEFLSRMASGKGRVLLTAAGPNQPALDELETRHGVFTHFLLRGLRGAADADGDGLLTVSELQAYLAKAVSDRAETWEAASIP